MPRTEIIQIRVSAEEKARAEAVAKAQGLTLSSYLRRCFIIARTPRQRQAA